MEMKIALIICAYLLGSIPFALVVGKLFYKIDIREHGSGNLGGTNTFRVLGKKAGFAVTIGDILKGTIASLLPLLLNVDLHPIIIGMFAIIGHVYPIFAKFKGGKAVATSAGVILAAQPLMFLVMFVLFFLTLYLSKYVSLSSVLTGLYATIYALLWTNDYLFTSFIAIIALFVAIRHRANMKRIFAKTEPKITWM